MIDEGAAAWGGPVLRGGRTCARPVEGDVDHNSRTDSGPPGHARGLQDRVGGLQDRRGAGKPRDAGAPGQAGRVPRRGGGAPGQRGAEVGCPGGGGDVLESGGGVLEAGRWWGRGLVGGAASWLGDAAGFRGRVEVRGEASDARVSVLAAGARRTRDRHCGGCRGSGLRGIHPRPCARSCGRAPRRRRNGRRRRAPHGVDAADRCVGMEASTREVKMPNWEEIDEEELTPKQEARIDAALAKIVGAWPRLTCVDTGRARELWDQLLASARRPGPVPFPETTSVRCINRPREMLVPQEVDVMAGLRPAGYRAEILLRCQRRVGLCRRTGLAMVTRTAVLVQCSRRFGRRRGWRAGSTWRKTPTAAVSLYPGTRVVAQSTANSVTYRRAAQSALEVGVAIHGVHQP